MTRAWDEFAAAVFDVVPPGLLLLLALVAAGVVGTLWYWFPAWVPRRLPRWRLPRWRWPKWRWPKWRRTRKPKAARKKKAAAAPVFAPTVVLADGTLLADRLAAEGRYAEAIRQRLRDVVGDLTAAGVVAPLPGTTAAEVAADAAVRRPAVAAPLAGATDLFSEIWYGDRPALPAHDERMRALTGDVRTRMRGVTP
ncbi:hypothetical protein GCM10020358_39420 [Amorphoplanes nipponensis]|uniref:Protein-glutamine gamma-glutamyltransferase-like C-terminal domain-containing protein n=1 Tax=Actinoplanes nipponensis TaxID=135950 RepID=A0A919MVC2_9ACTN|nr:DUF4129 domain-containing protein [Actinoplanes nipponensis]GIE51020.1 hypothetical protein Ani05nite_45540 [Actinoplanes nipponensis]